MLYCPNPNNPTWKKLKKTVGSEKAHSIWNAAGDRVGEELVVVAQVLLSPEEFQEAGFQAVEDTDPTLIGFKKAHAYASVYSPEMIGSEHAASKLKAIEREHPFVTVSVVGSQFEAQFVSKEQEEYKQNPVFEESDYSEMTTSEPTAEDWVGMNNQVQTAFSTALDINKIELSNAAMTAAFGENIKGVAAIIDRKPVIYINTELATKDTLLHEMIHFPVAHIYKNDPALFARILTKANQVLPGRLAYLEATMKGKTESAVLEFVVQALAESKMRTEGYSIYRKAWNRIMELIGRFFHSKVNPEMSLANMIPQMLLSEFPIAQIESIFDKPFFSQVSDDTIEGRIKFADAMKAMAKDFYRRSNNSVSQRERLFFQNEGELMEIALASFYANPSDAINLYQLIDDSIKVLTRFNDALRNLQKAVSNEELTDTEYVTEDDIQGVLATCSNSLYFLEVFSSVKAVLNQDSSALDSTSRDIAQHYSEQINNLDGSITEMANLLAARYVGEKMHRVLGDLSGKEYTKQLLEGADVEGRVSLYVNTCRNASDAGLAAFAQIDSMNKQSAILASKKRLKTLFELTKKDDTSFSGATKRFQKYCKKITVGEAIREVKVINGVEREVMVGIKQKEVWALAQQYKEDAFVLDKQFLILERNQKLDEIEQQNLSVGEKKSAVYQIYTDYRNALLSKARVVENAMDIIASHEGNSFWMSKNVDLVTSVGDPSEKYATANGVTYRIRSESELLVAGEQYLDDTFKHSGDLLYDELKSIMLETAETISKRNVILTLPQYKPSSFFQSAFKVAKNLPKAFRNVNEMNDNQEADLNEGSEQYLGTRRNYINTRGTRLLEDQSQIDFDLGYTVAHMHTEAMVTQANRQIEATASSIQHVYDRRSTRDNNRSTYSSRMLKRHIESSIYGTRQIDANTKIGKIVNFLGKYTSLNRIALNPISAVENLTTGQWSQSMEIKFSQQFDDIKLRDVIKNWTKAKFKLDGSGLVQDYNQGAYSNNKLLQAVRLFDSDRSSTFIHDAFKSNKANLAYGAESILYSGYSLGERVLLEQVTVAYMMATKVKRADKTETTLWEVFGEDGTIEAGVTGLDGKEFDERRQLRVGEKIKTFNTQVHGIYSSQDPTEAEKYAFGRMFLQFHKYIYRNWVRRFGSDVRNVFSGDETKRRSGYYMNRAEQQAIEGYWHTVLYMGTRYLRRSLPALLGKGDLGLRLQNISKAEKYNLAKASVELLVFASTAQLARMFVDDEDEDKENNDRFDYWMATLFSRISASTFVGWELTSLFGHRSRPLSASLGLATNLVDIVKALNAYTFADENDEFDGKSINYERKSGSHLKGDSKLAKEFWDVFPGQAVYAQTVNIKDQYEVTK